MRRSRFLAVAAAAFAVFAISCGDQKSAEQTVEDAAAELGGGLEESAEIMKDTYDAEREKGEGRVDAAGEAYEKVLEAGADKAAK